MKVGVGSRHELLWRSGWGGMGEGGILHQKFLKMQVLT